MVFFLNDENSDGSAYEPGPGTAKVSYTCLILHKLVPLAVRARLVSLPKLRHPLDLNFAKKYFPVVEREDTSLYCPGPGTARSFAATSLNLVEQGGLKWAAFELSIFESTCLPSLVIAAILVYAPGPGVLGRYP